MTTRNSATAEGGGKDLRRLVVVTSAGVSAALTLVAWVLLRLRGETIASPFDAVSLGERVLVGSLVGTLAGAACAAVVWRVGAFAGLRRLACEAIRGIEPRATDLVVIALAAGWVEELLFRGALEPAIGTWLTAVAFVVLHGVVRIRNRRRLALAAFLAAASLGFSGLLRWKGLEGAMAAHAAYDLAVLLFLRAVARR